jgi:hypothetical protein
MVVIPAWDEYHGWHRFVEGSYNEGWCALCDCLPDDHTPLPEGKEEIPMKTTGGDEYVGCK